MQKERLKQELTILFETGGVLAQDFAEEQEVRQRERDAWKEAEQKGESRGPPPESPDANFDFRFRYQRWYTCALPLVREAAPDRYAEFQGYYEQPARKPDDRPYLIHDYFGQVPSWDPEHWPWLGALNCFVAQLCIVQAAHDRLEWQSIVASMDVPERPDHAERNLQLAELEAARDLIKVNEQVAAVIGGTILQRFLQALAKKHKCRFRKLSPPPQELADSLRQAKLMTDDVWSLCTRLAGIHARIALPPEEAPTKEQSRDLIDGTIWLITNMF